MFSIRGSKVACLYLIKLYSNNVYSLECINQTTIASKFQTLSTRHYLNKNNT